MARVFVSYSSQDAGIADEVSGRLQDAGHDTFLDRDLAGGIAVGDEWERRLHERLRWADAVVCLVTAAFVRSTWCASEVAIARSRGSRLLPVMAEAGVEQPFLTSLQHVDLAEGDRAWSKLFAALQQVDAVGGLGWPDDRSPFPGLLAFGTDEHRAFFGRSHEVSELAELLRSPSERAGATALLVTGPSGCGKSSLVRAGLLPTMAAEPGWLTLPPIQPRTDPVAGLVRELAAALADTGSRTTVADVRHRLVTDGLTPLADELLHAAPGRRRNLLLVVDQFEELLTQVPDKERADFVELLRPALDGPVQVVATLRPEFLEPLLASPELADLATRTYTLRPLLRDALPAVIEGPAQLAGIEVDDDLVARLVADTDGGGALPLLAYTLAQLADGAKRGSRLLASRYEQLGGVQGTLTRQADAALGEAIAAGGRSREDVVRGLLRLVTVDEQGRPTRWRVSRADLPDEVVAELEPFVARRLLTTDTVEGAAVVEVAHEAFLTAWAPLKAAIEADTTALRARRGVELAAQEWETGKRPAARLWERGQLAAALADTGARQQRPSRQGPEHPGTPRWRRRRRVLTSERVSLSPRAREFLEASVRRDRRKRRRSTTVLALLLVVALLAAGIAVLAAGVAENQLGEAEQRQRLATARLLMTQAEASLHFDPRTALQLGLAAGHLQTGPETSSVMFGLVRGSRYRGRAYGHGGALDAVAYAPNGRTVAVVGSGGAVDLWDRLDATSDRALVPSDPANGSPADAVAYSPDATTLAVAAGTSVQLWDLTDPAQPRERGEPLETGGYVSSVAFSSDERTLAAASDHSTAMLWDVKDPNHPIRLGQPLAIPGSWPFTVTFAPGGRMLATAGSGGVELWDVSDPGRPRRFGAGPLPDDGDVNTASFSPDGHTLVTGASQGSLQLWDVAEPARPRRLAGPISAHIGAVKAVAFSPDGVTLASAGEDKATVLWDVTDPVRPVRRGEQLGGHSDAVNALAFAPLGDELITVSNDGTGILWDMTEPTRPRPLGPPLAATSGQVNSIAFAPDGHTLAAAGYGSDLWNVSDPKQPARLGESMNVLDDGLTSIAFAPDGRSVAIVGGRGRISLWDVADPGRPRLMGETTPADGSILTSVVFSPDGTTLATAGWDDSVSLWDVTDAARIRRRGEPLAGHRDHVNALAFSPDGRTVASASSDGSVVLWDVTDPENAKQLGVPLQDRNIINDVAFSPDGTTLATTSYEYDVVLWDLTDPTHPRENGAPGTGTSSANTVAFAPDSQMLASGRSDGTVGLWDLTDPARMQRIGEPLTGHQRSVVDVAFSPDGNTLASGSEDETVQLWNLSDLVYTRDLAFASACRITGGGFDPEEWARSVPGLAYENSCSPP